ncbi:DNA-binding transcriptional ArsR family regulator [Streptosporangium album]|uniref:DNA-binding transcriptional ArsR family regulator n=1 Tax=Streptosporangium album TaxID=47479 RepID=A0A7W7WD78_9ACTN|nr:hypothetical protein [Streptosporangium album]MBB4942826.1 DNA-binding transcriptional ArsR family regulator [Streptosporangium album]
MSLEGLRLEVKRPTSETDTVAELQQTRRWYSAMRAAESYRWTGARGLTIRRVLRAVLKAAQLRHSMVIDFGIRHLALLAGLDESTVAKILRILRDEADPFIDLVRAHHGDRADTYRLLIPQGYAEAAAWRRFQPGRLGGIHPVFRMLGSPAAFLYEHLPTDTPTSRFELRSLTGLSATAVSTGLLALAEEGMAERVRGGWVRGPADPGDVATRLGVPELVKRIIAKYRRQRAEWRRFLAVVEAFGRQDIHLENHPIPLQDIADAGPPPWMEAEPHGPPSLVGAGISAEP